MKKIILSIITLSMIASCKKDNGIRAFVNGNSVNFRKTSEFDDSYKNFRNYLDLIFNYAGPFH
ncbi:DUF4846 domain-containing protein [Chryseobacterium sp. FH2]|uniref:DUF4846 domain-containing protein n=1 Tax=Chryseobacterium sp. FH2 TaxID=1674291 RepID=UPI000A81D23E|nr:DUF4846 domain-containing protein [Chryseobacterium sp. FH2]